jgi:hypothetical protein
MCTCPEEAVRQKNPLEGSATDSCSFVQPDRSRKYFIGINSGPAILLAAFGSALTAVQFERRHIFLYRSILGNG